VGNLSLRPLPLVLAFLLLVAGCSGAGQATTTEPPGTAAPPSSTVSTTTLVTSTAPPADRCDAGELLETVNRAVAAARLPDIGGRWTEGPGDSEFAGRTTPPDEFATTHAFDCALLAAHASPDTDRLLLAAWTGHRMAWVIQTTDQPATPYDTAVRVDLLAEQPWGEWVDTDVWAVTLSTGNTLVIGTVDYSLGATAKSWLVWFPEPPGPPPQIAAEKYAWPLLEAAGARNVGIAEPSETSVASLAFSTPRGSVMVATVGPLADFDPRAGYLSGERSIEAIGGVDVQITLAGPDQLILADAAFSCDSWGWRLEASMGTLEELTGFLELLLPALECRLDQSG
jgi:hypothetical protein